MENNYWVKKKINAGEVVEKTKKKIIFKATDSIPEIKTMSSSCGCTTPKYNNKTKELEVVYSANRVPVHLRNTTGHSFVTQTITIIYADNTKDFLNFTVKIIL